MNETIEVQGLTFKVELVPDTDMGPPWEEHGRARHVSDWTTRPKRPGEMELCCDRSHKRFYDFRGACQTALKDLWDAPPYGEGTARQRAARAAMADCNYLRRWCNDQWWWAGVVVTLLDDDGDETDYSDSLWGVESDAGEYLEEVAKEVANEIIYQLEKMGRAA